MGVNSYRKVVVALMVGWEGSGQINRPSLTRGGSGSGVTGWLGCRGVWALELTHGAAGKYLCDGGTLVWPPVASLECTKHLVTATVAQSFMYVPCC